MRIGFIGLGAMGRPMAVNLLGAGYEVLVFDVVQKNVEELRAQGALACTDYGTLAAGVELVITSLPNATIVESVMLGEDGVFAHSKPGTVIIDMSTVAPASTGELARKAVARGLKYMDAPVSGGVPGAAAGTLTVMAGCDGNTFQQVLPVLKVLGKNIFHVGDVGSGNAIKLVNNMLLGANMAVLAEALALGRKLGLSAQTMNDIIGVSSGRSYALEARMEKRIMADDYDGGFSVDLQYKDLSLALEAAGALASPLPVTSAARQVYQAARDKGLNGEDIGAVVKVWEDRFGVRINADPEKCEGKKQGER